MNKLALGVLTKIFICYSIYYLNLRNLLNLLNFESFTLAVTKLKLLDSSHSMLFWWQPLMAFFGSDF